AGGNQVHLGDRGLQQRFNPPPAVRPGETRDDRLQFRADRCFNPPPAVRPGETVGTDWVPRHPPGFNPPPAVRPGETWGASLEIIAAPVFQSAPGGEAGGNLPPRRERWTVKLF